MTNIQQDSGRYAHLGAKRSAAALKGIIWSSVNATVPSAIAAGVFLLSSRMLQPAEFGLVAFAISLNSLVGAFAPSGFGDALIQRKDIDEDHLATVFWMCLIAGLVVFGVLCVAAVPVAHYTEHPIFKTLMPLIAVKVIFDMAMVVPSALLARAMSFHLVAMRTMIASAISGAVCIVLLLMGLGIWALAFSQVAASAASCVGALWAAGWRPVGRPRMSAFKDLKEYGFYTTGTNLLNFIYPEQLLIGSLLGPTALGIYGFARRIFQILNDVIAGALSAVSHALLSSLQTEREKLQKVFLMASYASAAFSFAVFGGLASIAEDAVPVVFGQQWVPAIASVQFFCIVGLLASIGYIQAALIKSKGKANWWFWYQMVKRVAMTLVVFISYQYGVTAVVLATALTTLALFPATMFKSASLIEVPITAYLRTFASPLLASVLMFFGIWLLRIELPEMSAVMRLACSIACGAVLYPVVLGATSYKRLAEIVSVTRSRRKK